MYLHLGQDVVVRKKDILGIFDLDNTSHSHITRAFLKNAENEGRVTDISGELPRSFAVVTDKKTLIYLSQISTTTLLRRFESGSLE
jgi:hypothetical protein